MLAVAHRAGNSLMGLHQANLLGADVVEADVHAYRGRLEVRHLKTAGPLPFLWDRWELVSARAPRLGLEELVEAGRRGATLMLDLKGRGPDVGRLVVESLERSLHPREVWVCGRTWPSVDQVSTLPHVRALLSARTKRELGALRARLDDCPDHAEAARPGAPGAFGVSMHASLVSPEVVEWLRERVQVVLTWPVDDGPTLEAVAAAGVTGVISDTPAVLRAARAWAGPRR